MTAVSSVRSCAGGSIPRMKDMVTGVPVSEQGAARAMSVGD